MVREGLKSAGGFNKDLKVSGKGWFQAEDTAKELMWYVSHQKYSESEEEY